MSQSTADSQPLPFSSHPSQGNLLGLLTAAFYALFTVLPDSNSLMVSWPWVFIWQVGLICPVVWLLGLLWQRQATWLGNHWDWWVGLLVGGLAISTSFAPFPNQARWYGWAALCGLAALYALSAWLQVPERRSRLLTAQGYLSLIFILESLVLWGTQTYLPERQRLAALQAYGVTLPFSFATVELRNWAPIGHQNYVAGYLVLVLPLLWALGYVQRGWRRWLWWGGVGLGLVDLYTTSSRAGWLAGLLLAIASFMLLLGRSSWPRRWLSAIGVAGLLALGLLIGSNTRFQATLSGLFSGQGGGELAFRQITNATGWLMGVSRWWAGNGLGSVPLLYQQFRPAWAGREAELVYQLHSTPAQVWAELGLWGIGVGLGTIALLTRLTYRWLHTPPNLSLPQPLIAGLLMGLLAYGVVSLTDYQLDNLSISGSLMLYLAILSAEARQKPADGSQQAEVGGQKSEARSQAANLPGLALVGVGLLAAAIVWLIPIQRAWMLSSQAFTALSRQAIDQFGQQLTQAHQLAPWEPYYAHQLGWNLGNQALTSGERLPQSPRLQDAIAWFQIGNQASPNQEFGHTNLAWLLAENDPKAAIREFGRSAQLLPAKRGVFYGLGLTIASQSVNAAMPALVLEGLRDPLLLTSPIWKLTLPALNQPLLRQLEARYTTLLTQAANAEPLTTQLHQSRGFLRWWVGDLAAAHADWDRFGTPLSRLLLATIEGQAPAPLPEITAPGKWAIAAWLNPADRQSLLQQAWIRAEGQPAPPDLLQSLVASMNRSTSLDQWLRQTAPTRQSRRQRAGFGVLSRHIDGVNPTDYLAVVENIPIVYLFPDLLPDMTYLPDLDRALQPDREAVLKAVR